MGAFVVRGMGSMARSPPIISAKIFFTAENKSAIYTILNEFCAVPRNRQAISYPTDALFSTGIDIMPNEIKKIETKEPETKPEVKEAPKPSTEIDANKPPLVLIKDPQKIEKAFSHSDLEGIYRLKIGKRKGLDIWIVDGVKVRRELYIDFVLGGNDQIYKFIPAGEIWIDNASSVEELEFTIIHEVFEREKMMAGLTYVQAHKLAAQEELEARINKTESIDELRDRWFKQLEIEKKQAVKDDLEKEPKPEAKTSQKDAPKDQPQPAASSKP